MNPLVSIIMPVYNGAAFLKESLESVYGQTLQDFEIVAVDDGSSDDSWQILSSYASRDPRIRLTRFEKNRGHAEASNTAIQLSKGEFVARQDQDDISLPERLEKQVQFFKDHPDVGLLGSAYIRRTVSESDQLRLPPSTHTAIRWALLFDCAFAHSSVMIRNSIFQQGEPGYQDVAGPQDYELWQRLARRTHAAVVSTPLLVYRKEINVQGNMSALYSDRMAMAVLAISGKQIRDLLPQKDLTDTDIILLRRLRRPWSLSITDIETAFTFLDLMDAFEHQADIDKKIVRLIRRRWMERMLLKASPAHWQNLISSGLMKRFFNYDPMILPKSFLSMSHKVVSRSTRGIRSS